MSTNVSGVKDATLQKFCDAVIASIKYNSGASPSAAPNAFKDRLQQTVGSSETSEIQVIVKINPGGMSASAEVRAVGARAQAIVGAIDTATLATKLV